MDPVSQAFLGSGLAQSFAKKDSYVKSAFCCGALGGMAPDLDVLIRSANDPLLAIEFHRHFTHSLFFIPFGGFLVSGFLWLLFFRKKSDLKFALIYLFTTLGFATHGLLDACTAYGTQILWPFSNYRATWNVVSIIDPLFTLPLIGFCLISYFKKEAKHARAGIYLCLIYLLYGFYNQLVAKEYIENIAKNRGHQIERIFLSPSLANNILWRTIYKSGDKYYVDAVNVRPFKEIKFYEGSWVEAIDKEGIFTRLSNDSIQRKDIERFTHFAKGYIYIDPENQNIISDLRYSFVPSKIGSLWGIRIDENNPQSHAKFISLRNFSDRQGQEFIDELNN